MLHNSITPFANKLKLLQQVTVRVKGPSLKPEQFHRLLNIRNSIAHGYLHGRLRATTSGAEAEGKYLVVETLRNDGSFVEVEHEVALKEAGALLVSTEHQIKVLRFHFTRQRSGLPTSEGAG
jgi:hypothetical protein